MLAAEVDSMRSLAGVSFLAVSFLLLPHPASSGCLKERSGEIICGQGACDRDKHGIVFCAPSRYGTVIRTRDGQIQCGRGACLRDRNGEVICSSVEGGSVFKEIDGTPRCEGACERGSQQLCERTPAGR
jgi:hypothetical protein